MRVIGTRCVNTIADPMSNTIVVEREITLRCGDKVCSAALADIRQRVADGERSPVLARHVRALGLDDVLIALARGS